MKKFFSRFKSNKWKSTQYLKYAIGEITLVVIGILIALSINNWNEERKDIQKETAILAEILSDLDKNVALLNTVLGDTGNLKKRHASMLMLDHHLENKLPWQDSLSTHFPNIFTYYNVNYKTSGFSSFLSFGSDLIRDDSLRQHIGVYYTNNVPQTRQQLDEVRDDFYNYMLGYMRMDFITTIHEGEEVMRPVNYNLLLEKTDFLQSLKIYASITGRYIRQIEKSIQETKLLRQSIQAYLFTNN